MQNASEELSTELTISDLRNIARLINASKDKVITDIKDKEILEKIEYKIVTFLNDINETV
jgi:hypothetical protein